MCLPEESQLLLISLYGAKMVTITNEKCPESNSQLLYCFRYTLLSYAQWTSYWHTVIVSVRALTEEFTFRQNQTQLTL